MIQIRMLSSQNAPHEWFPGELGWLLTPTISRPPVLVEVKSTRPPADPFGRFVDTQTLFISPVTTAADDLTSDGGDPTCLPLTANPADLFAEFENALAEQLRRCKAEIRKLEQLARRTAADTTMAGEAP